MAHFHVLTSGRPASTRIQAQRISIHDVVDALRLGLQDFLERPSHYFVAVLLYPFIGLSPFVWASHGSALQITVRRTPRLG